MLSFLTKQPRLPADTRLAEELVGEGVVETANLTSEQTGASGTIFISTAMGSHGPRVKYCMRPRDHGDTWMQPEVNDFIQGLRRL